MRVAMILFILTMAQVGWGTCAGDATQQALAGQPLTLIPTMVQELTELRVETGNDALQGNGTMSAAYLMQRPAEGSIYLNFHVDVACNTGNFVLHTRDIHLDGAAGAPSYAPMDWFIDDGLAEVHADSLMVSKKAILQFTIEVPRAGLDELTLSVQSQRIGTVREIRERVAEDASRE